MKTFLNPKFKSKISNMTDNANRIGIPHFKGIVTTARSSNYTINKAILDIMDGAISFMHKVPSLDTQVILKECNKKLYQIKFSDNYHYGFENIHLEDEKNPFNMAHQREGHEDDRETSEFGRGMKFSAIFLADVFEVYTRVNEKFYRIKFDFREMAENQDAISSYEYTEFEEISQDKYQRKHPFEYGSTLILDNIIDTHSKNNYENVVEEVESQLVRAYSKKICISQGNLKIFLGNKQIIPEGNIFENPKCAPFNTETEIKFLEEDDVYYLKTRDLNGNIKYGEFQITDRELKSLKKIKKNEYKKLITFPKKQKDQEEIKKIYENRSKDFTFINFRSTYSYYDFENIVFPKVETDPTNKRIKLVNTYHKSSENYNYGRIYVYRDNRCYDWINYFPDRTNSIQNYTYHEIEYTSKKVNKLIGMNYNKDINTKNQSKLTLLLTAVQAIMEERYTSDSSVEKFKILRKIALENNLEIPDPKRKEKLIDWKYECCDGKEHKKGCPHYVETKPTKIGKIISKPVVKKVNAPKPVVKKVEDPKPIVKKVEDPKPIVKKVEDPKPIVKKVEDPKPIKNKNTPPPPAPQPLKHPEFSDKHLVKHVFNCFINQARNLREEDFDFKGANEVEADRKYLGMIDEIKSVFNSYIKEDKNKFK